MRTTSFYPCTWLLTVLHVELKVEIIFVHNFRGICHDLPAVGGCGVGVGRPRGGWGGGFKISVQDWRAGSVGKNLSVGHQCLCKRPLQYQLWSSSPGIGWEVKGCYCWGQIQDDLWDFLAAGQAPGSMRDSVSRVWGRKCQSRLPHILLGPPQVCTIGTHAHIRYTHHTYRKRKWTTSMTIIQNTPSTQDPIQVIQNHCLFPCLCPRVISWELLYHHSNKPDFIRIRKALPRSNPIPFPFNCIIILILIASPLLSWCCQML